MEENIYRGVFVGIPCNREQIHRTTYVGSLDAQYFFLKNKLPYVFSPYTSGKAIHHIRNEIANIFMYSNYEWLLFIDDDMGFQERDIEALFEVKEALVIGACPTRNLIPKVNFQLEKDNDNRIIWNAQRSAVKALLGGTGVMLIHRNVFDAIKKHYPNSDYLTTTLPPELEGKTIYNYFGHIRDSNKMEYSEDISFCLRYREAGGSAWVPVDTLITHAGMHLFTFPKSTRELIMEL